MIETNDWMIKPDIYRSLQQIRKRIRSIHGEDIRIMSSEDVETLFRYRDDKDPTLVRMLNDLASRLPDAPARNAPRNTPDAGTRRMYRGQVVSG